MFLVFGLITILVGILVLVVLPDSPMMSRMTSREKTIAIARLKGDTTGVENKMFKSTQLVEALTDSHMWLICLITTSINIPNAAVSVFQATIIKGSQHLLLTLS
jgi:sugar phosphate permease